MSTNYSVNIKMSQATANALNEQGFYLYGFKAVASSQGGGVPLVWFSTQNFGLGTAVNWTERYQAFTTTSSAITHGTVTATNPYDINLEQTLNVNTTIGTGKIATTGTPLAIGINNQTSTPFTCGISQVQGNTPTALCAFPLNGNMLDVIAPIEKVVFMFSTTPLNTGAVVFQAFSQAALIDLTANNSIEINFDINNGWDNSDPSVTLFPASTNLVPYLIQKPNVFMERLKRRLELATQLAR